MTITTLWTINSNNDDDDVWLLFLAITCHYYSNIMDKKYIRNVKWTAKKGHEYKIFTLKIFTYIDFDYKH